MGRSDHLKPHQFKPGQSGCPGGRGKSLFNKESLNKLTHKYLNLPKSELRKLSKDDDLPAADCIVVANILRAVDQGVTPDQLLHYLIGKAADVLHAEVKNTSEVLDGVPTESLLKLVNDK